MRRTRSERGDVERCVLASDIPRMERGRRISGRPWRRRNRRRGRSALAAFLVVALVILSAGIWWLATEKDYDWDRLTAATAPEHLAATPETQQRRSGGVVATPPPATGSTATDFRAISTSAPPEPRRAGDRTPAHSGSDHAPAATPMPPTPVLRPDQRHIEEKRYMLRLINAERERVGVTPVELGDNAAAQLHAESALENCFSSHWGIDGLKPYMRYSLAGGYQSNGENGSGLDYCIGAFEGYRPISGVRQEISETMKGWMSSPGHRGNIMDPWHRRVNIGIAWDRYNVVMYQHFEGDYVEYNELPTIAGGDLSFSGTTKGGLRFNKEKDLGVQIYYDTPPTMLTLGQVARTYCYDSGVQVASLREPLSGGYNWTTDRFTTIHDPCPSPYDVPRNSPAPRSPEDAHQLWQQAYAASQSQRDATITVPWITASRWVAGGAEFAVRADIGQILDLHGDGVYSLVVWGKHLGQDVVISEYSIFHGLIPPDTYRAD